MAQITAEESKFLSNFFLYHQRLIDLALNRYIPEKNGSSPRILDCMRHALEGGKRLRPTLTLSVVSMLGEERTKAIPTAVAIELIHTHSLILDDLPCMDNDILRRGRLTCHAAFDENTALLAADALVNAAVSILARNHIESGIDPTTALKIIQEVGEAVGMSGLIGAQMLELASPDENWSPSSLEHLHFGKTAALFRLSARAGAMIAEARQEILAAITDFAEKTGIAFQIMDDILDAPADSAGTSSANRPNYAVSFGIEAAKRRVDTLTNQALDALRMFGDEARPLRLVCIYNAGRRA